MPKMTGIVRKVRDRAGVVDVLIHLDAHDRIAMRQIEIAYATSKPPSEGALAEIDIVFKQQPKVKEPEPEPAAESKGKGKK